MKLCFKNTTVRIKRQVPEGEDDEEGMNDGGSLLSAVAILEKSSEFALKPELQISGTRSGGQVLSAGGSSSSFPKTLVPSFNTISSRCRGSRTARSSGRITCW